MLKLFVMIGLLLTVPANARPVFRDLTGLWMMHFKYSGDYNQRSRVMAVRFTEEGNCSSPKNTKCVWFRIGEQVLINYYSNKNGEWQQANRYKTEAFSPKRVSGSIYRGEPSLKIGTWVMVRSERETNLESVAFNSLWNQWELHYRLKTDSDWNVKFFEFQMDGSCLVQNNSVPCTWSQWIDFASFWLPIDGMNESVRFETAEQPIVYNPTGQILSAKTNEVLGSWYLAPTSSVQ